MPKNFRILGGNMQQSIRRIDPISAMKVAAVLYAVIGLVIGAVVSLVSMLGFMATSGNGRAFGLLFGAAAIIIAPIFYAVIGAIGAAIMALVYNVVAGLTGGLKIELE